MSSEFRLKLPHLSFGSALLYSFVTKAESFLVAQMHHCRTHMNLGPQNWVGLHHRPGVNAFFWVAAWASNLASSTHM